MKTKPQKNDLGGLTPLMNKIFFFLSVLFLFGCKNHGSSVEEKRVWNDTGTNISVSTVLSTSCCRWDSRENLYQQIAVLSKRKREKLYALVEEISCPENFSSRYEDQNKLLSEKWYKLGYAYALVSKCSDCVSKTDVLPTLDKEKIAIYSWEKGVEDVLGLYVEYHSLFSRLKSIKIPENKNLYSVCRRAKIIRSKKVCQNDQEEWLFLAYMNSADGNVIKIENESAYYYQTNLVYSVKIYVNNVEKEGLSSEFIILDLIVYDLSEGQHYFLGDIVLFSCKKTARPEWIKKGAKLNLLVDKKTGQILGLKK